MAVEHDAVTVLGEGEAWRLLAGVSLGRLVTYFGGQLEIFPVNFVVADRTVLFRTAEGTKLFTTVMSDQVLFEADDHTDEGGWSVIVRGAAHILNTTEEIHAADRAGLIPWVATEKLRYVQITPTQLSARRFLFGPEPHHGGLPG